MEMSVTEQRYRAVLEVEAGVPVTEVAKRFGVSRQAVQRWLRWYTDNGLDGPADRASRPHSSPGQTRPEVEAIICELRRDHPRWGARRLVYELGRRDCPGRTLSVEAADHPSVSTMTTSPSWSRYLAPFRRAPRCRLPWATGGTSRRFYGASRIECMATRRNPADDSRSNSVGPGLGLPAQEGVEEFPPPTTPFLLRPKPCGLPFGQGRSLPSLRRSPVRAVRV